MFDKTIFTGALALLLVLSGHTTSATQKATLKRLKALAGDWSLVDPTGEHTDLRATYMVVAGGAAVIETLLPDTPQETVTVYHLEGDRVTVTQLSARGAPTRLVPRSTADYDTLGFAADLDENAEEDQLTGLQLTLIDEEHVRVEWFFTAGEDSPESRVFELQREERVEELAARVSRLRVNLESLQRELDRRLKREITVSKEGEPSKVLLETGGGVGPFEVRGEVAAPLRRGRRNQSLRPDRDLRGQHPRVRCQVRRGGATGSAAPPRHPGARVFDALSSRRGCRRSGAWWA